MIMLNTNLLGVSVGVTTTTTPTPTANPTTPGTPTTPTTTPTTSPTAPATTPITPDGTPPSGSTNNQPMTVTVQPSKERTTIMAGQFYKPTANSKTGVAIVNLIATPQEGVVIVAPVSFDTTVPPESWTPRQIAIADFVKEYPILI